MKLRFAPLPFLAALLLAAPRTPRADAEPAPVPAAAEACHASYPDFCIPPPPPDLNCPNIRGPKPFRVRAPDPHRFDRDRDGWGCE
ncbi:MAG TPA: hypothetical protein VHG91_13765 [Longimicrobium sp.]|nr:hypothetical protein [Longimicrobium sp.]